jgi:RNA polymerase sigma-70 factor (ECF subfamily)
MRRGTFYLAAIPNEQAEFCNPPELTCVGIYERTHPASRRVVSLKKWTVCSVSTDQELVARTLAGDQQAFAELVETYQRSVYNLTYRMLSNPGEAEDAAQEAFLRAYQHLERYDPDRSFKTWLLSIASNHCIDRLRKRRLTWLSIDEPLPPHPALNSDAPNPESAAVRTEQEAAIQDLLGDLAPDYRAAVVLRYWYDLSYAEIANTLDTTESAIKSRLYRARQQLAEMMRTGEASELIMAVEGA